MFKLTQCAAERLHVTFHHSGDSSEGMKMTTVFAHSHCALALTLKAVNMSTQLLIQNVYLYLLIVLF